MQLYKQKNGQIETQRRSKNKLIVLSNKSIKEMKLFQLYSPTYQMKSNYSEFKKYNSQNKSIKISKSKEKAIFFQKKALNFFTELQNSNTSYNKSNRIKYSVDNKPLIKKDREEK